jgi:hypothetical protein
MRRSTYKRQDAHEIEYRRLTLYMFSDFAKRTEKEKISKVTRTDSS